MSICNCVPCIHISLYCLLNNCLFFFRVNDTPIVHFYGAHCIGTESSLMACDFIELSDRMCGPSGFVSIHCCEL